MQTYSLTSLLALLLKLKKVLNIPINTFLIFLKIDLTIPFFLSPTDKYEIINIISSSDPNKSIGPNNIPTKKLKFLKSDISTQLSDIFNDSFLTGVFPSILKIAKDIAVHKKHSKLDYSNYCPISFLSNLLQKLTYSRTFKFFNNDSIYPLFDFWQKYSTTHALISPTEDIRKNLDVIFL